MPPKPPQCALLSLLLQTTALWSKVSAVKSLCIWANLAYDGAPVLLLDFFIGKLKSELNQILSSKQFLWSARAILACWMKKKFRQETTVLTLHWKKPTTYMLLLHMIGKVCSVWEIFGKRKLASGCWHLTIDSAGYRNILQLIVSKLLFMDIAIWRDENKEGIK